MKKLTESRDAIMARLRAKVALGQPIIGAGAGVGLSAKAAEMGGIDLLVVYNSGRYRMAGRGSLAGFMPYGDANAIVMEMAGEVLTVVEKTPVLAGVCGTDPFRRMDVFLRQIEEIGFAGVQNFPTVGQFDGIFRENLEATGMPYAMEVEMICMAHIQGLLTTPYCFKESEAEQMADAGADIIVAHMGLTTKGTIGAAAALSLDEAVGRVQRIADAAHATQQNVLVLCHGGPIAEPEDAAFVFERTRNIAGFYGASSIERLPAERAIRDQTQLFRGLKLTV